MSSLAPPPLLTGLLDDAAVFPPGLAPMAKAVPEHVAHRRAWYRDLIGPLLVPVAGLASFRAALAERGPDGEQGTDEPLGVGLIGDATQPDPLPGLFDAVRLLVDEAAAVRVVAVEVAVPKGDDQVEQARRIAGALDERLPAGVLGWVEVHSGLDLPQAIAALAAAPQRIRAKYRTGGTRAELFPTPADLAAVLHRAVEVSVPLKLTAGLHHAVRHTDPATGFAHHGFVNVLAAVATARDGGSVSDVSAVLSSTDGAGLAGTLSTLDAAAATAVRTTFASFGCCGVTDPVDDLVALGLLEAASDQPGGRE